MTQPINDRVPIINDDGTPTQYFIRQLQERGITVDGKITAEQAVELIEQWAAARDINTTNPLLGGGPLSSDLTLSHATSGVTPGNYTNANISVDATGHVTAATNGSGGGGAWTLANTTVISSPTASVPITGLSGAADILVLIRGITFAANDSPGTRLSDNNGSSYYSGASDYIGVPNTGVEVAASIAGMTSATATAARTVFWLVNATNITGAPKIITRINRASDGSTVFVGSTNPINAFQVRGVSGNNMTAGTIYTWTR